MKSFALLYLSYTLLLGACAAETIVPPESTPSAFATSENSLPSVQPTVESSSTPEAKPSQAIENPDNPCPDFHLTPQSLELPVEKISNAPQGLNTMCSSPSTGNLYLLTNTEVFRFDINTLKVEPAFQKAQSFDELTACAIDNDENIYLADSGTNKLFQYHKKANALTELERYTQEAPPFRISPYASLRISPKQELFFSSPDSSKIFYYTQDLTPKLFELNYHANIEKFDNYFNRKQFAERSLNTIKNTVMTVPSSITFGPKQMFIGSDDGWREIFSVNLTSGEISPLPSVAQRGKKSFIEKSNPIGIWNLNYSPRYQVLFQGYGIPTWTSPETGCWQGLSTQIKPAGLAEGGDGHLYIIDSPTKTLHRIKLSPEIFKSASN